MPQKKHGWGQWNGDLPQGPALEDLDALAKELGMTRAEANRVVLVAWSRALRGRPLIPTLTGGSIVPLPLEGVMNNGQHETEAGVATRSPLEEARARGARSAKGLDLDDD